MDINWRQWRERRHFRVETDQPHWNRGLIRMSFFFCLEFTIAFLENKLKIVTEQEVCIYSFLSDSTVYWSIKLNQFTSQYPIGISTSLTNTNIPYHEFPFKDDDDNNGLTDWLIECMCGEKRKINFSIYKSIHARGAGNQSIQFPFFQFNFFLNFNVSVMTQCDGWWNGGGSNHWPGTVNSIHFNFNMYRIVAAKKETKENHKHKI